MFSGCWLCGRWAVDSVETQACKFHRVYQYMISAMNFFFCSSISSKTRNTGRRLVGLVLL